MSETLSAGERARMREWHAPDLEPGGVQPWCICGFRWPCPIERSLATIAQQAETIRDRAEREKRDEWREGLVNVLDHEGNYLGCMGTTAWRMVGEDAETIRELKEELFSAANWMDRVPFEGALDAAAKARAAALTSTEAAAVEGEQEDDHFGFGCCGGYVDGVTNERMHRAECRS